MAKKVTMETVAQAAGVSRATVSLVARNSPLVARETKLKVEKAMAELDYVADFGAARLRSNSSKTIGLVVPSLVTPFFTDFLSGAELAMVKGNRVVLLANSNDDPDRQDEILMRLRSHAVDGIILCPAAGTDPGLMDRVSKWDVPIVLSLREIGGGEADYAGADYAEGVEIAFRHLQGLGHQDIAFISVSARTSVREERLRGFRRALEASEAGDLPVIETSLSMEGAIEAAKRFSRLDPRPTAAICFNDFFAASFMHGLREAGLEPGRDCAVVGLDDLRLSELLHPSLTTVAMHPAKVGAEAARLLTRRIQNPEAPLVRTLIKPDLVVRASTEGMR